MWAIVYFDCNYNYSHGRRIVGCIETKRKQENEFHFFPDFAKMKNWMICGNWYGGRHTQAGYEMAGLVINLINNFANPYAQLGCAGRTQFLDKMKNEECRELRIGYTIHIYSIYLSIIIFSFFFFVLKDQHKRNT